MNKYFIQLFREESTVILPGFGALTMTSEKTGDIMFMPYLKYDDGKLASYIAKTDGIDKQDAENIIAKFIREIEAELAKGESFGIFEFGSFFKNKEGEIEFQTDHSTGKGGEEKAKNKPAIAPVIEVVEAPVPEPEPDVVKEEKETIATPSKKDKKADKKAEKADKKAEKKKKKLADSNPTVAPVVEPVQDDKTTEEIIEESVEEQIPPVVETPIEETPITPTEEPVADSMDLINSLLGDDKETSTSIEEVVEPTENIAPIIEAEVQIEAKEEGGETTEATPAVTEEKASKKEPNEDKKPLSKKEEKLAAKQKASDAKAKVKADAKVKKEAAAKAKLASKTKKADTVVNTDDLGEKKTKKKRGIGFWLLIVLLIAIIGGAVWAALNFDTIKPHIPFLSDDKQEEYVSPLDSNSTHIEVMKELSGMNDTNENSSTSEADSTALTEEPAIEEIIEEKVPVAEVVKTAVPKKTPPTKTIAAAAGSYHIIVGAFGAEANANNLVNQLNGKGYQAMIAEKANGLFKVSAGLCNSRQEGLDLLEKARVEFPSAWLKKN